MTSASLAGPRPASITTSPYRGRPIGGTHIMHSSLGSRPRGRRKQKSRISCFPLVVAYFNISIGALLICIIGGVVVPVEAGDSPTVTPTLSVQELAKSSNTGDTSSTPLPLIPSSLGTTVPLQPCDRSRKVFTSSYGEISDGPTGTNYTQVLFASLSIMFLH